jgi:hypothetical protein
MDAGRRFGPATSVFQDELSARVRSDVDRTLLMAGTPTA